MHYLSNPQFYFLCILIWLITNFFLRSIFKRFGKSETALLRLPPSPPSLPIIGHIHHFRPLFHKSFQKLSSTYGPLLYLRIGSCPCLLVSSPKMVEEIFKTQDINFAARPEYPSADSLLFGKPSFTVAPYGDYWRFMKKLCVTQLLGQRQIERSQTIRRQEVSRFLNGMIQSATKTEAVDVGEQLVKLTNNIICRMVASTSFSEEDDESKRIIELVRRSLQLAAKSAVAHSLGPFKKLGVWLYSKELNKVTTGYDELIEKLIKEHEDTSRKNDRDKDLIDILLQAYHDDMAEFKITRPQIKSFILDLFLAGTSTSAETIQWTIGELMNHPNVYKTAREEIESIVGKRLVEETDIPNLPYLQAIVKETLRLYPNVPWMPRKCHEDCKIKGFDIPKNTMVFINAYSIMRDPEIWKNPDKFMPERFLVSSKHREQNFEFLPFGGGRRVCVGKHLAYVVMNITIASIIQCIDWKLIGDGATVSMEERISATLNMASPLRCLPSIHFNPFA